MTSPTRLRAAWIVVTFVAILGIGLCILVATLSIAGDEPMSFRNLALLFLGCMLPAPIYLVVAAIRLPDAPSMNADDAPGGGDRASFSSTPPAPPARR